MAEAALTEADLEAAYPWIKWREPIPVRRPDLAGEWFGCRFCIAFYGLRGKDVPNLHETERECLEHLAQFHA